MLAALLILSVAAAWIGANFVGEPTEDTLGMESAELAELLKLEAGMQVAEVGAGRGALTVAVAQRLGPAGRVFFHRIEPTPP